MARQDRNNTAAYRIIAVCFVLTLAYSMFIIAVFLRAKAAVCSTTSAGINLSIAFSLPTIVVVGIRCHLFIRQRSKNLQSISPSTASPKLESACTAAIQLLLFLWVILACINLLVAVRAPICLDQPLPEWQNNLKEQNWRYGLPCRLHRGLVAMSVLMALGITALSFFDSIAQHHTRRGTSLISCYCTCRNHPKKHPFAPSFSSGRSESSLGKEDPLYLIPGRRYSRIEHEQWQQRRNSLSSQKAIYPHRYQWHDQRPRYASYNLPPSMYSSTLRSVSEGHCLELSDRNSSMTSSLSSKTWVTMPSTRPSTISSSRSRAGSNPERGDLRREKAGEAPATSAGIPDVPPLPTLPPPAWAPTLQHTPLSADPTLRALSTGAAAAASRPTLPQSKSTPDLLVQPLNIKKRESRAPVLSAATPAATPASTKKAETKAARQTSPRKQSAAPMPSGPPPPLPTLTVQPPQPGPSAAAPGIPTRAAGHSAAPVVVRPRTGTSITSHSTSSSTPSSTSSSSSSRSSLRRPDPIRHRQYHHHPHHPHHGYSGLGLSQSQLPLQQYQHQRVWRHGHAGKNLSVYSASSYGTTRTSMMTRPSNARRSSRPLTAGRQRSGGEGAPSEVLTQVSTIPSAG